MRRFLIPALVLAALLLATDAWASGPPGWPVFLWNNARDNAVQDGATFGTAPLRVVDFWSVRLGGPLVSSPMIQNSAAYVGSSDGNLYAINVATRQIIWHTFLGTQSTSSGTAGVSSSPAYAADVGPNGAVLVGGGGQAAASDPHVYVYALDARSGKVLWQTAVGTAIKTRILGSPLYSNSRVYVGTAGSGAGAVYELDAQTGTVVRKLSMAAPLKKGGAVSGSISTDSTGSRIFVPTGHGQSRSKQKLTYALLSLNSQSLQVSGRWQAPAGQAKGKNGFSTSVTVFPSGSRTLMGAGMASGMYYALNAAHVKKGPVWKRKLGNTGGSTQIDDLYSAAYASGPAYPGGHALFVAAPNATSGGGELYAVNPSNGHVIWSVPVNGETSQGAVTVYDDLLILPVQSGVSGGAIEVRSVSDGRLLGSTTTAGTPDSAVVVLYGALCFTTSDGMFHEVVLRR